MAVKILHNTRDGIEMRNHVPSIGYNKMRMVNRDAGIVIDIRPSFDIYIKSQKQKSIMLQTAPRNVRIPQNVVGSPSGTTGPPDSPGRVEVLMVNKRLKTLS